MIGWQIVMLVLLWIRTGSLLHEDVYGRPRRDPLGLGGVIGTLLATGFVLWVYYKAGALSCVVKWFAQ